MNSIIKNIIALILVLSINLNAQEGTRLINPIDYKFDLSLYQKDKISYKTYLVNNPFLELSIESIVDEISYPKETKNIISTEELKDFAKELLKEYRKLKGEDSGYMYSAALLFSIEENFIEMVYWSNKAFRSSNKIKHLLLKCRGKFNLNDYYGCIDDCDLILKLIKDKTDSGLLDSYYEIQCLELLIKSYHAVDDYNKSIEFSNEYLKLNNVNSEIYFYLGYSYEAIGDHVNACKSLSKAAELDISYFNLLSEVCK